MNRLSDDVRAKVLALYESGHGSTTIGRMLGIGQTTALDVVTLAGKNRKWRWDETTKEKAVALYRSGAGYLQIRDELNIPITSAMYMMRKCGIARSKQEAALLPRRGTIIPATFSFLPLTKQTAWLLGIVFADGSMQKHGAGVQISVGHDDADGVEKIRGVVGANLGVYKHKTDRVSQVRLCSRRLWRECYENFGLTPHKAANMQWPQSVRSEMLPHFVRGLYDCDGSWYRRTDRGSLKCSYGSVSQSFVEALRACLIKEVGLSTSVNVRHTDRSKDNLNGYQCRDMFTLEYGHKDSVVLGEWLHAESSDEIRYARKHAIWARLKRPCKAPFGH